MKTTSDTLYWRCEMGGGKSGGGGDSETTIRFAPYVEDEHRAFLSLISSNVTTALSDSPYSGHESFSYRVHQGIVGAGYTLASFPSLYDIYGKFMAGLDVEALYNQTLEDLVDNSVINDLVSAESDRLSDELEETALPRYEVGHRDINSVMSSSFVIGKGMMESARVKTVSRFSAELRYKLLPLVNDKWKAHLDWNTNVTRMYTEIIKFYIAATMDVENHDYELNAKRVLWPFTVLDYERAALGALTGAKDVQKDVAGASSGQKVLGGAASGAAAGWMISGGNPIGAGIGAVLGGAFGLLG